MSKREGSTREGGWRLNEADSAPWDDGHRTGQEGSDSDIVGTDDLAHQL